MTTRYACPLCAARFDTRDAAEAHYREHPADERRDLHFRRRNDNPADHESDEP